MDEIFSRLYDLGGDWSNLILPHYVHIDLKPDAGCKMKDDLWGSRIVMMKLNLVKVKNKDE